MKNYAILFLSLFSFLFSFSQEKVSTFFPKDKERKDVFTVVNDADKKTTLFFIDKRSLKASQFNENLQLIDSLGINFAKKEVENIIGYSRSDNKYFVYWSGSNSKEIVAQCFDFNAKKTTSLPIVFDIDKEKVIDRVTVNNVFYIITISKDTSILNFYRFIEGKFDKNVVDCSEMKFVNKTSQMVSFWELYKEKNAMVYHDEIKNISDETPASLVLSTNKKKAYIKDNTLRFTFDVNVKFTQMLTINLTDFKATQKAYSKPITNRPDYDIVDSNSFLVNNVLMQIKTSQVALHLSVKDLDGNEIKNITLKEDSPIDFKNSEIIQENGSIKKTRILGNSNQLIRKTNNLNPSISGYYDGNKYHMVIGGVSYPQQNTSVLVGGIVGGLTGALIASAITYNYSVDNLNSYSDKKVVYIYSTFDNDFNNVNGDSKKTAFDKLRVFAEENDHFVSQTIFKFQSKLFFGGYNKIANEYSFYKFE